MDEHEVESALLQMYPGLEGGTRWRQILRDWARHRSQVLQVIKRTESGDTSFELLLKRSKTINPRRQVIVCKKYSAGILEAGGFSEMRGQPIAVERDMSASGHDMIAGATFCEAI